MCIRDRLNKLIEKYSTDEAAVIHAALMKKAQAGDVYKRQGHLQRL